MTQPLRGESSDIPASNLSGTGRTWILSIEKNYSRAHADHFYHVLNHLGKRQQGGLELEISGARAWGQEQ